MSKNILLLIIALICLIACGQSNKTEREGEPDIYTLDGDDPEMNEAIRTSNRTFDNFLVAIKQPKSTQSDFSIKMPFITDHGTEHIWLVNIQLKDEKIYGEVNNLPENTSEVKLGDVIEIDRNKISDWFYIDGDTLIGGLTIRVLRDRMSDEEKKQFDAEFGVRI